MRALEVVSRLSSILPLKTAELTTDVSVISVTGAGGVATVQCGEKHGLEPDDLVVLTGASTPISITSLTRDGVTGTMQLATPHDLTPAANKTVTISGANEATFNGTFTIFQIVDDDTIQFVMADSGAITASGSPVLENGESFLRSFDGAYRVLETPSGSAFTIASSIVGVVPDPIGTIIARAKPRISATATVERVIDVYTEQPRDSIWMFAVLDDVVASKSRLVRSDAVDNLTDGAFFRQQIIQPVTIYALLPAVDSVGGREPRDRAGELFRPICQSILGHKFDSRLFVGDQGKLQFVSHGTFSYDTAVYVHAYQFQQVVDLTFDDTVGPADDVAFRCVDLVVTPTIPGGGTQETSLSNDILLDEPETPLTAPAGFPPQAQSLELNETQPVPTERLADRGDAVIGIANEWSVGMWVKPQTGAFSAEGIMFFLSEGLQRSDVEIRSLGATTNDPIQCRIWSDAGGELKRYQWASVTTLDQWAFVTFTWDGSSLLGYFDGSVVAPTTLVIDNSGSMAERAREISIGANSSASPATGAHHYFHSVGVWDVALSAAEIATLYNFGAGSVVDWGSDVGDYVSSADLQHWWRLGADPTSLATIAQDYGLNPGGHDLTDNAASVTTADLVTDAP